MNCVNRTTQRKTVCRILVVTLIFLAAAVHPCWAWRASYKKAKKYKKANAFEQAVEMYEETLADEKLSDKKRAKIEMEFNEFKVDAAENYFKKASALSLQNMTADAIGYFEKAVQLQPENGDYALRLVEEKDKQAKVKAKIDAAVAVGVQDKKWDEALKQLESYTIYESTFPQISEQIEELKKKAGDYYAGLSDEKLSEAKYQKAYEQIEKANQYADDPQLKNMKLARHHLLMSEEAWKSKNYLKAHEEIQKGLEFEPDNPNLKAYQQRFFDEWLGIIYNEAVRANNDGRYAEAKARLLQISKLSPGYLNTEELLDEVRTTLASAAYERAQSILSAQDRNQIGIAVANLLVAQQEHSSLYPDIEARIEEAKKLLRKELEFRVSVDFKNSSQDPSAAGLVREQILSKISNHPALKHITILDRDSRDEILREQGLGQGFLDETTALEVKKIKGIQAGIKGEVIKLDVKETGRERPSYGSARYVSGTRWVPNPDYMRAQSDIQAAQQRVLSAQQSLNDAKRQQNQMMQQQQNVNTNDNPWGALAAGLGQVSTTLQEGEVNRAQNDLSNAQSRLINTPQQIEEDIYSDYRYEIFDLKLNAEAVISVKVINFTTSEIGQVQTIRETDTVTDRYIPGDPSKNVPSDPLQLPSIDEMKNTILNKAIDKTFAALLSDLSSQAQNYYTLAKRAEKSNSADDAVENYMRYIYSAPDLSDAKVQEANEYIYNHIGIRVLRRKE